MRNELNDIKTGYKFQDLPYTLIPTTIYGDNGNADLLIGEDLRKLHSDWTSL